MNAPGESAAADSRTALNRSAMRTDSAAWECLRCGRAIIGTAYEGCHANLLICEDELLFRTGLKERDERV